MLTVAGFQSIVIMIPFSSAFAFTTGSSFTVGMTVMTRALYRGAPILFLHLYKVNTIELLLCSAYYMTIDADGDSVSGIFVLQGLPQQSVESNLA